MRSLNMLLLAGWTLGCTTPAIATQPTRLTEPSIRAFVARQNELWRRRDFAAFFALAAPEAVSTTERREPGGEIVSERRTVTQSRRSAERVFSTIERFAETTVVDRFDIARDGQRAQVLGHEEAQNGSSCAAATSLAWGKPTDGDHAALIARVAVCEVRAIRRCSFG